MATLSSVLNNLAHPKIVDAFLLSPTFSSKLPAGVKLFLRPNYPVPAGAEATAAGAEALQGEKFTWAIVEGRPGAIPAAVSGAIVNTTFTDAEFDALDEANSSPFRTAIDEKGVFFVIKGKRVMPGDPRLRILNFVLDCTAVSHSAGMKVIVSNGPRWVLVDTTTDVTVSQSYGRRADGSEIAEGRHVTSMYGALVSLGFEAAIKRDATASLHAAKAAAKRDESG